MMGRAILPPKWRLGIEPRSKSLIHSLKERPPRHKLSLYWLNCKLVQFRARHVEEATLA